ncbi:hypothetical protein HanXRQr2_Chr14g0641191 [Helianthus annuus]|uniref:Uncharacterized protein n=1 Tax=Helianthus annuus TaxID=4232 RepID=A0A9K3H7D2_HELAN|nr:hypothetical protein HanXRQr2_Chr14g0641191 [Helianthus annuus]
MAVLPCRRIARWILIACLMPISSFSSFLNDNASYASPNCLEAQLFESTEDSRSAVIP